MVLFIILAILFLAIHDQKKDYLNRKNHLPKRKVRGGNETGARRGKIAPERRDNREEIAFGIINYPRKCENGKDINEERGDDGGKESQTSDGKESE